MKIWRYLSNLNAEEKKGNGTNLDFKKAVWLIRLDNEFLIYTNYTIYIFISNNGLDNLSI